MDTGDVVHLINSGGIAVTKSYDYDAFGVERNQTLYGDVNGDGKINIADSILLSQYLGGQNVVIYMKESNVSGNGVVDQADYQLLSQYIAEIVLTLGPSPIDSPNPFRYCGEYFDKETNTVYLRARYYNPRLGIFTQEDPARAGLNWYTYCRGNPVGFIDPWGLVEVGLRAYAEQTYKGCKVSWDDKTQIAKVIWNDKVISVKSTKDNNQNGRIYVDDSLFVKTFGVGGSKLVV